MNERTGLETDGQYAEGDRATRFDGTDGGEPAAGASRSRGAHAVDAHAIDVNAAGAHAAGASAMALDATPGSAIAAPTTETAPGAGSAATGAFAATAAAAADWPLPLRIAFRFAFCYLALYNMVVLANTSSRLIPGLSSLVQAYSTMWQSITPWVGARVLGITQPITYFPSGSGDKTTDWILIFCYLTLAVAGTIVWSLLDRRRTQYRRLHDWLRVAVRYAVGFTMLGYGMAKVIKLQFPDPSLARLIEPLGEFSPMGLLWTFMGYSKAYTFFGGAAEVLGGLLLFFRRTTMLGAFVTGGVMLNVAMMNFAYDVPVKLLASHLCLMCGFLLLPEARRLLQFFVLNRPVAPSPVTRPFTRVWPTRAAWAVKAVFVGYAVITATTGALEARKLYGELAPKPPIYGLYEVDELRRDNVVVPPLLTESRRWRKVIVGSTNALSLRLMDDSVVNYGATYDAAAGTITLSPVPTLNPTGAMSPGQKPAPHTTGSLTWVRHDATRLTLTGTILGETYVAQLRRIDETAFRLKSRGFHWVSELPFNR